ncbi:MAG: phosphotriesterase [Dehalococcoidia bacterium]
MVNELSRAGKVQSVKGLVSPDELGATLTHEHILSDADFFISIPSEPTLKDLTFQKPSLKTFAYARHYHDVLYNIEDFKLSDIDTAIDEVMIYKQFGGGTLVDATSIGLGRDPVGLARISRQTGVNIVMGASYYVALSHNKEMNEMTEDTISEKIIDDLINGVDNTGIRAGIIGEIGCGFPIDDNELKVLRGSAQAQAHTGFPLLVHPGRDVSAPLDNLNTLLENGADISKIIIGHLDRTFSNVDDYKKLADKGCYIEWDLIGEERSFYDSDPDFDMPTDAMRMDQIATLIADGYGKQILIAHDLAYKHRLMKYGGHGYGYILANIVPRMRQRGIEESAIQDILVNNPKRALTITK